MPQVFVLSVDSAKLKRVCLVNGFRDFRLQQSRDGDVYLN